MSISFRKEETQSENLITPSAQAPQVLSQQYPIMIQRSVHLCHKTWYCTHKQHISVQVLAGDTADTWV